MMKVKEAVGVERVTLIKDSVLLALPGLIQVVLTVVIEAEVQAAYVFVCCFLKLSDLSRIVRRRAQSS